MAFNESGCVEVRLSMDCEFIRQAFKPERIRLLLVGEAPPNTNRFFYVNSNMTRHTQRAFEISYQCTFEDPCDFLCFFKKQCFYLEDLCQQPILADGNLTRNQQRELGIPELANRIRNHEPDRIAIIMFKIERQVKRAVLESGVDCPVHVLPFPGNGSQNRYIQMMSGLITQHLINEYPED
jgi:hypothetical protein